MHSSGRGALSTISKVGLVMVPQSQRDVNTGQHQIQIQVKVREDNDSVSEAPTKCGQGVLNTHTEGPLTAPGDEPTCLPLWSEQRKHVLFCLV